jgi:hypothetical protein
MLLDVYGINHGALIWNDPDDSQLERFRQWNKNTLILSLRETLQ